MSKPIGGRENLEPGEMGKIEALLLAPRRNHMKLRGGRWKYIGHSVGRARGP